MSPLYMLAFVLSFGLFLCFYPFYQPYRGRKNLVCMWCFLGFFGDPSAARHGTVNVEHGLFGAIYRAFVRWCRWAHLICTLFHYTSQSFSHSRSLLLL